MYLGQHEAARQELNKGLAIRRRLGDSWGTAQSLANLAHLALIQPDFDEAATQVKTALTLADQIGSAEIQIEARWIQALIQAETGQLEQGLQTVRKALEMAQTTGLLKKESDCLKVLGVLQTQHGQFDEAEVSLLRSVEFAQKQNDPYRQGQAIYALARLYQHMYQKSDPASEEWRSKALANLGEAARLFQIVGAAHYLKLAQLALGQIQGKRNTADDIQL